MPKQKICQDSHEEIIYSGNECPLCIQREMMDAMLDDKTDQDQQNIMELYRRVEKLEKLMRYLMPDAYKKKTRQIISRVLGAKKQNASTIGLAQQSRETGREISQAIEFDS